MDEHIASAAAACKQVLEGGAMPVRIVLSALGALFLQLVTTIPAEAGLASLKARWPAREPLSVCFFGGSPSARAEIKALAEEWTWGTRVVFDFGAAPAFNDCDDEHSSHIRIGFAKPGFWAYLGVAARSVPPDEPTLNLEGLDGGVGPARRGIVLQQFGQVLGFLKEEQNPYNDCTREIDIAATERLIGWSSEQVQAQIRPILRKSIIDAKSLKASGIISNNGEYVTTAFDRTSVMRLLTNPAFFNNGERSPCYGPPTDALSDGDRKLARLLYPPIPADISAASQQQQLSVHFESILAAEHFGYFVEALHKLHRIPVRKKVLESSGTIGDVIVREGLAPRGIVAAKYEEFMCRLNPHACEWRDAKALWRNVRADRNYVESGIKCGDPALPRSVLCLPNIRLEPYPARTRVLFNGSRDSLDRLTVDKYRGCTSWDAECQTYVRRLNSRIEDKYLDVSERVISPGYVGSVTIPSDAYRLVIEYSGGKQRKAIEDAVEAVKRRRAKQLGIQFEDVAVFITYPVGAPQSEASTLRAEPVKGYTNPLERMHYPYDLDDFEKDLEDYRRTSVGMWDLHVDDKHCDLTGESRIVYATAAPNAGETFIPVAADKCGDERPGDYSLNLRYDHGTAIASILSAPVNGKGIAGVVPGMRLWAWEVFDGDQFNQAGDPVADMKRGYDLDPVVINVSQSYDIKIKDRTSRLEQLLFGTGRRHGLDSEMLFVVSAGLTNTDDGGRVAKRSDTASYPECATFPACWSGRSDGTRGLISVVALNAAGDDLLKDGAGTPLSNHGQAFDVAAIGAVTAGLHGGWFGPVQGSSFATAYVTGLSALVYGRARKNHTRPDIVDLKNRILATADNPPGIRALSRFGMINFWKAMNYEDDLIRYRAMPGCDDPCWKKVEFKRNRGALLVRSGVLDGLPVENQPPIDLINVRSIQSDGEGLYRVVFKESKGSKRLRQYVGATLEFKDKANVVYGDKSYQLRIGDFEEFIACSFGADCGD